MLKGQTSGYGHHPQLLRFRETSHPVGFIAEYLRFVRTEAACRGYRFAGGKISRARAPGNLAVTRGQLQFEWRHLVKKVNVRDPKWAARLSSVKRPRPHPLFRVVPGQAAE